MIKLILKYLFVIICILLSITIIIKCIEQLEYKEPIIENTDEIDSLNDIIKTNNIILKQNQHIIDSLYNQKSQTIINYETTIKNYSNPSLVSDDSISKFISKELYNWK